MESFATYMLNEEIPAQKMIIAYYLSKKTGIFFDKSIVLRAEIARLFVDYMKIDVDKNTLITAMLLCNCKKVDDAQKMGKLETFAEEGAKYLGTLGFNKRFCKICEEVNRYSGSTPREKESDILEAVDQFTGLILNRIEREAFTPEEALVILQERNLKFSDNRYLNDFVTFVQDMEKIYVKEMIDVPVIKKLVSLHNKEANVKTFIAALGNKYSEKIDIAIQKQSKKEYKELLATKITRDTNKGNGRSALDEVNADNVNDITKHEFTEKSLFSKEIAERVLSHNSKYRIEE